jgi:hypothetical protein
MAAGPAKTHQRPDVEVSGRWMWWVEDPVSAAGPDPESGPFPAS